MLCKFNNENNFIDKTAFGINETFVHLIKLYNNTWNNYSGIILMKLLIY